MKNLLKHRDVVACETKEQHLRIVSILKAVGAPLYDLTQSGKSWDAGYPNLVMEGDSICGNCADVGSEPYKWLTESEFIAKAMGIAPESVDPLITVGSCATIFNTDGSVNIGPGGSYVSYETLRSIYGHATAKKSDK